MSDIIASNRDSVDMGAQDMINTANMVADKLDKFYARVNQVVGEDWVGDASAAFKEMQDEWSRTATQLNTTLTEAAKLVQTGNSELHDTDKWLAGRFAV